MFPQFNILKDPKNPKNIQERFILIKILDLMMIQKYIIYGKSQMSYYRKLGFFL